MDVHRPTTADRHPGEELPVPDFMATLDLDADAPLTEDDLMNVAERGGSATGFPGTQRLSTTLTVVADDFIGATQVAIEEVTSIVPGEVVAIELVSDAEADRRDDEASRLAGTAEAASILGVSRQRVSQLANTHRDFPSPYVRLRSGPVWVASHLRTWKMRWDRGRSAIA
ncbi:MAG: hypothetical protein S0880_01110 [Actinomycetota bacterium]|nr:hypothetical protein [Actinomycetota bacterium]